MFDKNKTPKEEQNFWISYADLMAGLLFVFILLLGAIVVKYVFIQTDLQTIRADLDKEKEALNLSEDELEKKKVIVDFLNKKLKETKEESTRLSFQLAKAKNEYIQTLHKLQESRELNKMLNLDLNNKDKKLQLSSRQIEKITAILNDKTDRIKLLKRNIREQKDIVASKLQEISLNKDEIEKLKQLLLGYELRQKEYISAIDKLQDTLEKEKHTITLKDEELALLEKKLIIQSKEHQKLVEEFDIAKVKIKNLTGIRIKVVKTLREKLGSSMDIDPKSGALKFSSNILFNTAQYKLRKSSQKELSRLLKKYIHTLLLDENIKEHINRIIIEGHTDSQGTYLYNLELSQKRALEVMKFLYKLDFKDKSILEKYISASGRSYSQLVYKNGMEDREASRRIELKFELKNEQAIKEIENFLEKNDGK